MKFHIFLFTLTLVFSSQSMAEERAEESSEGNTKNYLKYGGIGAMVLGGATSLYGFISIVGAPAGGDPCKEEGKSARRAGESSEDCWDRLNSKQEEERKRGRYLLPIGLAVSGVGIYLFKISNDNKNASIWFESSADGLQLAIQKSF